MGVHAFGDRGLLAVCDGGAVTAWTHDSDDDVAASSGHSSRWALRPQAADEVVFEDAPVTRLAAVASDILHETFPLVAVASDTKPVEVAGGAHGDFSFEYRSAAQLFSYKPDAVALGQAAFQPVAAIPSLAAAGAASSRGRVSAMALSASSQQLAVGDEHGCVALWSLAEAAPRPAFACSLQGGFGPRVNGAALWLYGGQSLLLAWSVACVAHTIELDFILHDACNASSSCGAASRRSRPASFPSLYPSPPLHAALIPALSSLLLPHSSCSGDRAYILDTRAAAAATPAVNLSAAEAAALPLGGRPPAAVPRVRDGW